jgi:thiol-disulfide isomerase/thioredoxin
MNKSLKILIGLLFAAVLFCMATYLSVIHSSGTDKIQYLEPHQAYHSFSDLLNHPNLKGKVVYVDYWHTGCAPCLKEFESLPALKEKFEGDEDLAFLYLGKDRSVPGEEFRWKRMIEKKEIAGNHHFMTDEKFIRFWNETVIDTTILKAFPHYLIIDREGRIKNHNAPRPSDEILVDELRDALKN